MARLDAFTRAYIEAALWSTNDESDEQGGEPLDANYGPDDIAPETMELIIEDCADFQTRFGHLIEDDDPSGLHGEYDRWEKAGHDFWLTREGHGAGFWDGDWPKHGDELTAASKSYGSFDLYVGDDGMIYGPPPDWYRSHGHRSNVERLTGKPANPPAREVRERGRSQHVADFDTLPDIVAHAQAQDGATHVVVNASGTMAWLFFPLASGKYAEARVRHERGYWHAEGPADRDTIDRLPRGAMPIESYLAHGGKYVPGAGTREMSEAIHGYNIEVVYPDERFARRHESQVGHIIQQPLVSQGALRDGYRMEYGPIDRDDYRRLEGAIYSKLGNAVRVRLVQVAYAGGRSDESRRRAPSSRFPRRRR